MKLGRSENLKVLIKTLLRSTQTYDGLISIPVVSISLSTVTKRLQLKFMHTESYQPEIIKLFMVAINLLNELFGSKFFYLNGCKLCKISLSV